MLLCLSIRRRCDFGIRSLYAQSAGPGESSEEEEADAPAAAAAADKPAAAAAQDNTQQAGGEKKDDDKEAIDPAEREAARYAHT